MVIVFGATPVVIWGLNFAVSPKWPTQHSNEQPKTYRNLRKKENKFEQQCQSFIIMYSICLVSTGSEKLLVDRHTDLRIFCASIVLWHTDIRTIRTGTVRIDTDDVKDTGSWKWCNNWHWSWYTYNNNIFCICTELIDKREMQMLLIN